MNTDEIKALKKEKKEAKKAEKKQAKLDAIEAKNQENIEKVQTEKEKKHMGTGKKVMIGIIIVLLVLTAGAYSAGAYYFSQHFFPGSTINGLDCSFKTVEEAQTVIADEIATYTLNIAEINDGKEHITADKVGLEYVPDKKIGELQKAQNYWLWFTKLKNAEKYTMSATTKYDDQKLTDTVNALACLQNMVDPQDAYINETDSGYVIVPEVEGNKLDPQNILDLVKKAVESGETDLNLEELECYAKPSVYQDNEQLLSELDQLNKLTSVSITYDFGDRNEVVDKNLIKTWLVKGEDGNYTLSEDMIASYVHELAVKYDTFGGTRQFNTSDGKTITVTGGDYGWAMNNTAEVAGLKAAIEAGQSGSRTPEYLYTAMSRNSDDIGGTYVEVSITAQKMWFYKDGALLVETPVVTGTPTEDRMTHSGCFAVDAMKSPSVLKGEDYASEVTYWMPFNGNEGIHDADGWRTQYGGEIYKTSGSHGCVNTPFAAAEKIYQNMQIGVPVIVY